MSGGSFNYLCHKDATQILESGMSDLGEMLEALREMGYDAKSVADRTDALYDRLKAIRDELDAEVAELAPVWRAVEWWHSCDWSREQAFKAIGAWEERQRTAKGE